MARTVLPPALIVVALIGAWELAARWDVLADALGIEPFLVPAPSDIAEALWSDRELLADNTWVTVEEVLLGFGLSVIAGVSFAVALHLWLPLRRAVYPLLVASQTVPIIVVAPILVIWFDYGIGPKLAVIALICFFPITVNTLDGLRSVDPDLIADDAHARRRALADPAPGRGSERASLPVQRRQDRRRRRRDRRRVRRVGRLGLGPRPPDASVLGAAADRAACSPRSRFCRVGDRALRAAQPARATSRVVGATYRLAGDLGRKRRS